MANDNEDMQRPASDFEKLDMGAMVAAIYAIAVLGLLRDKGYITTGDIEAFAARRADDRLGERFPQTQRLWSDIAAGGDIPKR